MIATSVAWFKRFVAVASVLLILSVLASGFYVSQYDSQRTDLSRLPPLCAEAVHRIRDASSDGDQHCVVRDWYLEQVARISTMDARLEAAGTGLQDRAYCAYSQRHEARIEARERMPSKLDVMALRLRDLFFYGNPDGPTFDALSEGGDAQQYEQIIVSASMTNERVDQACEIEVSQ